MSHNTKETLGCHIGVRLSELSSREEVVSRVEPARYCSGDWQSPPWPAGLSSGVIEGRRGYRFRQENVTLAPFLAGVRGRRVVDLGAGSGSLLLMAMYFLEAQRGVGVEIDEVQADRLRRTFKAHQLDQVGVVAGDLRQPLVVKAIEDRLGDPADLIVLNPPFYPAGWGRPSASASTRQATHAVSGSPADFLRCARGLLDESGVVVMLFDAARLEHGLAAAASLGMVLERLMLLPRRAGGPPFRAWLILRIDGCGAPLEQVGLVRSSEGQSNRDDPYVALPENE